MTIDTYKTALRQAKADLAKAVEELGEAEEKMQRTTKQIAELRQTVTALNRLCGEPEFVEEDALGLTDVIRLAYRSAACGAGMTLQDVKDRIDSMGYAGRWGNLLASVHTVTKRLFARGEVEAAGNINGKDTFRWKGGALTDVTLDKKELESKLVAAKQGGLPPPPQAPISRFRKI